MERQDLGAMFARITRRLIAAEEPILAAHGLSMWEYVVLSQLAYAPAQSQLALAVAIGYDKTRLIALLDGLEGRGLLHRVQPSTDRRARIVRLTEDGTRMLKGTRSDIRAMERQLLKRLPPEHRTALLADLAVLAGPPSPEA